MSSLDYGPNVHSALTGGRIGGRLPMIAEAQKHYAGKTPNFRCAGHEDFRILLEKEKAVDAVLCATPDHLHACVSAHTMRAARAIYCEIAAREIP